MHVAQAIQLANSRNKNIRLNENYINSILKSNGHYNINVKNIIKNHKLQLQKCLLHNNNRNLNNYNKKYFDIYRTLQYYNLINADQHNQIEFLINNDTNLKKKIKNV